MQSLSAGYGGQRRRDLSLADWPALFEKYLAPWLVKETGKFIWLSKEEILIGNKQILFIKFRY